jgi:hypothetical protein
VIKRNFATFEADFPDDSEWTPSEELIRPDGRSVSVELARALENQGLQSSDPEQHRFYGWEFTAARGGERFWFLLQYPGPWLLIAEDRTSPLGLLTPSHQSLRDILHQLTLELNANPQFTNLRWFTSEEYSNADPLEGSEFP